MNLFDLSIISILCLCLISGIFTGLIGELFSVTGVLAGFYAASIHYTEAAKSLSYWIPDASKIKMWSFLVVFIGFLVVISILGKIVRTHIKIDFLKSVDRTFGAGIGIIKGILIVSVLLLTLISFLPKNVSIIKNSLLSSDFTFVSEEMAKVVSKDMRHKFFPKINAYERAWKGKE
jgi:membrane protein required for colicin V production